MPEVIAFDLFRAARTAHAEWADELRQTGFWIEAELGRRGIAVDAEVMTAEDGTPFLAIEQGDGFDVVSAQICRDPHGGGWVWLGDGLRPVFEADAPRAVGAALLSAAVRGGNDWLELGPVSDAHAVQPLPGATAEIRGDTPADDWGVDVVHGVGEAGDAWSAVIHRGSGETILHVVRQHGGVVVVDPLGKTLARAGTPEELLRRVGEGGDLHLSAGAAILTASAIFHDDAKVDSAPADAALAPVVAPEDAHAAETRTAPQDAVVPDDRPSIEEPVPPVGPEESVADEPVAAPAEDGAPVDACPEESPPADDGADSVPDDGEVQAYAVAPADDAAADESPEAAGGFDTVESHIDYTLADNVEQLILAGSRARIGIGNDRDNRIVGNAADNTLIGMGGNDTLIGLEGDDHLVGGTGDDRLVGGAGNDHLDGGAGKKDVAVFSGNEADYSIEVVSLEVPGVAGVNHQGESVAVFVVDTNTADGNDGVDTLTGIEELQFGNRIVSLTVESPQPEGDSGAIKVVGVGADTEMQYGLLHL